MNPIEICKAGRHTDMSGNQHTITVADLEAAAKAYDPSVHEAPFVIGHPKDNHPAYGWTAGLSVDGDRLIAHPDQLNPEFAEWVESGAYKKRSASFYPPNSANNPTPGTFYLRHVGFLGAQPPAIKGLAEINFSEADDFVEFSERHSYALGLMASLLSRVRDYFIEKNGIEEANKVMSSWEIDHLKEVANESHFEPEASFTEPFIDPPTNPQPPEGDDMSEELKAALADETQKREAAEAELTELRTKQAAAQTVATEKANADFAEQLVAEGQLLPKHKEKVVAILNAVPATADFAEGESVADALKALLSDTPKVLDFAEAAKKGSGAEDTTVDYAEGTSPESIEMDQKVTAYAKEHGVDYHTAFARVVSQ